MIGCVGWVLDWLAKLRIGVSAGVSVAQPSKVAWRRVRILDDRTGSSVRVGERTLIGASTLVCAEAIDIGDDVLVSCGCTIVDHNSHRLALKDRCSGVENWFEGRKDWSHVERAKVRVGNKAWIGFNEVVLKEVRIGEGAIVGAGSAATRDVPAFTVVAGNLARLLRELQPHER